MLTKNPNQRISAIDALHHDWFKIVEKTHVDHELVEDALKNMKSFHVYLILLLYFNIMNLLHIE